MSALKKCDSDRFHSLVFPFSCPTDEPDPHDLAAEDLTCPINASPFWADHEAPGEIITPWTVQRERTGDLL